jgi:hypothetical protein
MYRGVALVGCLLSLLCCAVHAEKQWFGVKGRLMCGDQPAINARVQLYDFDNYSMFDSVLFCLSSTIFMAYLKM